MCVFEKVTRRKVQCDLQEVKVVGGGWKYFSTQFMASEKSRRNVIHSHFFQELAKLLEAIFVVFYWTKKKLN